MNTDKNRLPDGELEVMQALWDCEVPASRADIEARLHTAKPMAATTLLTFLSRLAERGYVKAERSGRSAMYTPLVSREAYLAGQSRRFLDKLCGGEALRPRRRALRQRAEPRRDRGAARPA